MTINILYFLIGLACFSVILGVTIISYYNWNSEIQKSLVLSALIFVGSLIVTLYPIFYSLKLTKSQKHINTYILWANDPNTKIAPLVTNGREKRFSDMQKYWDQKPNGVLNNRTEVNLIMFYSEAIMIDILMSIKNYSSMGNNGMFEADPSGQNFIFRYKLAPTSTNCAYYINEKFFKPRFIGSPQKLNILNRDIQLPRGTKLYFFYEKYNESISLPTIVLSKKDFFSLKIRPSIGLSPSTVLFKNADLSTISATCLGVSIDTFSEFPAITSKNDMKDEYVKWVNAVVELIDKKYRDDSISFPQ